MRTWILATLLLLAACSSGGDTVVNDTSTPLTDVVDIRAEEAFVAADVPIAVDVPILDVPDVWSFDTGPDTPFVECEPGQGCFLDPCDTNGDCQSGWCLEHMGDGVCSQICQEECPPGWSCQAVGAGPDLTFVCVSLVSNLCKPCSTGADCKSPGGADDVCVDYEEEGAYCGGVCTTDDDCPWGFSCLTTVTVDGIGTMQCVADAGVCPCTAKSVALALTTPCEQNNEFGTCAGKRYCSDEGLTDCDAAVPAEDICNGLDDDCDGDADEDTCDDDNACTDDVCLGEEGCHHEPLDAIECIDGNPCTVADLCSAGECGGTPVPCDDDNICTDDSCDAAGGCIFTPNSVDCDDEDPCTVADRCEENLCVGVSVDCECTGDNDCAALEDGDVCNGTLICDTSKIPHQCELEAGTEVSCPEPEGTDAICLTATCDPLSGECSFAAKNDGFACDDGDLCTIGDVCESGECISGIALSCDDSNLCTDDSCDSSDGCSHVPNQADCDDGNACTEQDGCSLGQCVGTEPVICEDDNPCTADGCSPLTGCSYSIAPGPCDDGNPCTVNDSCVNGECVAGPLVTCDDKNPCTDDSCENGVCTFVPNEADCDDGNACTLGDHCSTGSCVKSGLADCDDDNVCTSDSCDPDGGCLHLLNQAPCNDGNLCTTDDVCQLGECQGSGELPCSDGNACTDDACSPEAGCTFTPNEEPCDDGNACTTVDGCQGGGCTGTTPPDCGDDNVCTDDICDAVEGCVHVNNSVPCSDNDACTADDQCVNAECIPGEAITCVDENVCTDDACIPETGCVFLANAAPCDDGNACTANDTCGDAQCDGDAIICDDNKICTNDSCAPESGCVFSVILDCCGNGIQEAGEECDDGNNASNDGCSAQCKSENSSGCADGSADQIFQTNVMVGCDGNYLGTQLASACGPGWHPANPNEYFSYGGKTTPVTQTRWVDTTWNSQGYDAPLEQSTGYYDCSNGQGWNGVCKTSICTWVSYHDQCYLTFVNHDYGKSYGCHCRGGDPKSNHHGVICVNNNNSKPRL